jgi:DNA-binding transcriptional MerR regulator
MTAQVLVPIGELSAATGVAVSALRHYDEVGVITPAERVGGKRRFTRDTVGRVHFVRRAQRFGFSLAEIRDILDDTSGQARQLAADKIDALRAQQVELATMIELLEEMMACGCEVVARCPAVTDPC